MSDLQLLSNIQLHDLELTIKHIQGMEEQVASLDDTISKIKTLALQIEQLTPDEGRKLDIVMPEEVFVSKASAVDYSIPKIPNFSEIKPSPVVLILALLVVYFIPSL
jgi:hypothetical protein